MAFEDLKDRLNSEFKATWERFQDTSLFQQMKERYDNLNPSQQKLAVVGIVAFIFLMVMSVPFTAYETSVEYIESFETKRNLVRELFKVSKQSAEVPTLPGTPTGQSLIAQVNSLLGSIQLVPEQIKGVAPASSMTRLIPAAALDSGVIVSLSKLNLNQIIEIGYQLQSISPSLKMSDMSIQSNATDTRYMDVTYELAALKIPEVRNEPIMDDSPPPRRNRNGRGDN